MTLNFFIRPSSSELKSPGNRPQRFTKVYVRLRDGRNIDQTGCTNIIVAPYAWDSRLELLNASKCSEELEWEKINGALAELRTHIVRKYISDSLQRRIGPSWLRVHKLSDGRKLQYGVLRRLLLRFAIYKGWAGNVQGNG
ncbi:MAG: hypothetical protein K6F25_05665 [Bacteroidales bacterium]|nr:hypothetical protein [Bacteroidales bacterium]